MADSRRSMQEPVDVVPAWTPAVHFNNYTERVMATTRSRKRAGPERPETTTASIRTRGMAQGSTRPRATAVARASKKTKLSASEAKVSTKKGASRRTRASVDEHLGVESQVDHEVDPGPEAEVTPSGRPKRRAAVEGARRMRRAIAVVDSEGSEGESEETGGDDGNYVPEEPVQPIQFERKSDRGVSGSNAQTKKKVAHYRIPEDVERVWYVAGSIILRQLASLLDNPVDAIRQSKMLMEMNLVAPDAFAEVFGGRADIFRMRRPELVKLGLSAGIKGLSTQRLEQVREHCKPLAFLSVKNYKLWRNAEKVALFASIRSNVLQNEPLWLERLINSTSSVVSMYRTALKTKLRLPPEIIDLLRHQTNYITFRRHYGSWNQTVYQYRTSTAVEATTRWHEFIGTKNFDIKSIISNDEELKNDLKHEKRMRAEILERVDDLRKEWKKVGADLDGLLSGGQLEEAQKPLTWEFLLLGGQERRGNAVQAIKAAMKYGISSERRALDMGKKVERFNQLSRELKKKKLEVPKALDPTLSSGDQSVSDVRRVMDVSWSFVEHNKRSLADALEGQEVYKKLESSRPGAVESFLLSLSQRQTRLEKVKQLWREHELDGIDDLSVEMSDEAGKKYPVTAGYILGKQQVTLESALKKRIEMRDKGFHQEKCFSLDDLERHPQGNHVYVCPCSYYAGRVKMMAHLDKRVCKFGRSLL